MKEELIQLSPFQWNSIMGEFHVKTAHDFFMENFMKKQDVQKSQSIIKRLRNIHVNFEAILQITDPKWNVEDQDNANARMRGTDQICSYMYTATEKERKEILDLVTKRTLARANKFKENG